MGSGQYIMIRLYDLFEFEENNLNRSNGKAKPTATDSVSGALFSCWSQTFTFKSACVSYFLLKCTEWGYFLI